MSMTIIDRFHPQRRAAWQTAADSGYLRQIDKLELLAAEQLRPLAIWSLQLLVLGGIFFTILNLFAYMWRTGQHSASLSGGQIVFWLLINSISYVLVLPLHELLHGIAFTFWGGRPYYGTKLPLALYCSAKEQVFPRNYYLVIGLAPLVIITLAGLVITLLAPTFSPYILFAIVGNISGAAGDLWVVRRLLRLPPSALIEDMETGYHAWIVTSPTEHATIDPM